MPILSRWFIKAGMLYFVFAMLLAVAANARGVWCFWHVLDFVQPVFYHALMVGWITQIIFGVSIWMFPRHTREQPRGSQRLGWATFYLLNIGLLMRIIAEPASVAAPSAIWNIALIFSAVLQWLAAIFYVFNIWKRVKGK